MAYFEHIGHLNGPSRNADKIYTDTTIDLDEKFSNCDDHELEGTTASNQRFNNLFSVTW